MRRPRVMFTTALWLGLWATAPVRASDPSAGSPRFPALPAMNLTAPQQQKLADLGSRSHGQAKELYGQLHKLRDKLSELYAGYNFDAAEARRLNKELNRVQGQLLELHLSEQQQLRGILTPEQFVQLQSALRQQGDLDKRAHGPAIPDHVASDSTTHATGH